MNIRLLNFTKEERKVIELQKFLCLLDYQINHSDLSKPDYLIRFQENTKKEITSSTPMTFQTRKRKAQINEKVFTSKAPEF